jgi:hypothetical protein
MDELGRWLDDVVADERSQARSRERVLRRAAAEGATFAGLLVDVAEQGNVVRVRTRHGRTHVGRVELVGNDFVVVGSTWVRLDAVAWVRPELGSMAASPAGNRGAVDVRLIEALARLAVDRVRVAVVTSGGEVVAGELRDVGADVLTIRLDGGEGGLVYVPGASVLEVLRSG